MKVKFDGHEYESELDIPDMGSIQCVEVRGNQRDYQGFTADKLKLPKYATLGTGSTATLIDPNGVESTIIGKYDEQTKTWYDLRGGVIV